ncbi:MAG: lipoate--protein ligase [Bacteroidales bacterium]|nr:lipoate--protein ligase [Bacteroidales bacterium]
MLYISDKSTDPYFNLAEEEFLLKEMTEDIFRLWRNSPSIIVGRYQNTIAEIDSDYIKAHSIPVVRRLSGGGAVFHDLGNLNFTFIQNIKQASKAAIDPAKLFQRFTSPIIQALQSIGVNAELQGRNDLAIDGKKFSGNAICIHKNRILMHGTLMFKVSKTDLSKALKPRPEKFIGKAVKSNVKRVTNISDHLKDKDADILWFTDFLGNYVCSQIKDITPYSFTQEQLKRIKYLKENHYSTDQWNFGKSPRYNFTATRRFPKGIVELYLTAEGGIIKDLDIRGDYFFTRPTEEFTKRLIGTPHTREDIEKKIGTQDLDAYFAGISSEDIVNLFF